MIRALHAAIYRLTSPVLLWAVWGFGVAWFWNENHQALMRGRPTVQPGDFIVLCFFAAIPCGLLSKLHRWMLPPVPVIRQRRPKQAKPVTFTLVRVAVPKQGRTTSLSEASMRRKLPPRLQKLLNHESILPVTNWK